MKVNLKKVAERKEKINQQRQADAITLIVTLAFCTALDETGLSINKIKKILSMTSVKTTEFAEQLLSNTYTDSSHDKKQIDTEYNREVIKRLCKYYGILYDEDIFTVIQ